MSGYFVYIMGHVEKNGFDWPVKVGITMSLGSRLASVQTGNWRRIGFAHVFNMGSKDLALDAERRFHERYAECRMSGEWFGMEASDALNGLCDIVCTIIEEQYPSEMRFQLWEESGASAAFDMICGGAPN